MRCNRTLKNPHSIARSLGPVCYKASGGGVFDSDLNASDEEWARREELLKAGGEIDLGVNWDYPVPGTFLRSCYMRVSVRYKDGAFEAYGSIKRLGESQEEEMVFASGQDLKAVYREAIAAGPTTTAQAYRARKQAIRDAKRALRRAS